MKRRPSGANCMAVGLESPAGHLRLSKTNGECGSDAAGGQGYEDQDKETEESHEGPTRKVHAVCMETSEAT